MPIRQLPPLLVNQIAAGEVIERPASVVKELVENSIDAGATRIDISIEQGGCELIRIADNGCGIPFDELMLAIAPHATSKITCSEDLDAIATMGFRGEALASIASVSRMSISSRPPLQQSAALIEVEGDQVKPTQPAGGPVGTTITVRNLFFNTPARRKFLRAEQTETTRVVDIAENLALAHPSIAFTVRTDDKIRFELPAMQTPRQRTLAILGNEVESELLDLSTQQRGIGLWGMAGKPSIARGTAKHQRLFLNGRLIVDRSINHAIKEAYRGLIEPTRHPTVVLFITLDPSQVDVNVHPTKSEVRFRNQASVHGAVMSAIRDTLRGADLAPEVQLSDMGGARAWSDSFASSDLAAPTLAPSPASTASFVEYFRRLNPVQKGFVYSEVKQALAQDSPDVLAAEIDAGRAATNGEAEMLPVVRSVSDVLQIHSSYIVTQDERGLVIIDQHALHERVMFEKLKARMEKGNLESQHMLMPATVEVDRSQMAQLDELKPLLARIGIEAERIGPSAIAVHSFTSLLFERGVDPVTFMTELLDKAANRADSIRENSESALHEVLDMMACKAAIKAGDKLAPEELAELLKYRETVERASNCPHGRPTTLRLTIKELEKQFGRT
jgi:DNA mismatch repair protein MutL